MSASAKFLLEFQATGDQEVVNKIREVGAAGQQAASELESLQGIEDPFSAVGEGAESAIGPITEVGSATEDLGGIFSGAGTATEDFGGALSSMNDSAMAVEGGLTEANSAVGGLGSSATTAMSGIGQMSGAIVGLGGTIGTAVSTVYRMQDAQLALDKAHLKAAKSTESARKAEVGFDNLLKSATGNTQGITDARNELSLAQDELNKLQEAGITSGAEYEAAQARVGTATAALRNEFVRGGGDANKFDAALNKMKISQDAMTIAARNLEKATRSFGQTQLETGLSVAGFVGTAVQAVSSLKGIKEGAGKVAGPLKTMVQHLTGGAKGATGLTTAVGRLGGAALIAYEGYKALNAGIALFEGLAATAAGEGEKAALKLKEAFDLTKLAGGFGSSGAFMELLGKLGLDKVFDDAAKAQKKLSDQNKETSQSTKELVGTIGPAADQFQYYGDQLVRNGDGAKFLAGEFKVLKDGTIQLDNGARNARLGITDLGTGTENLADTSAGASVDVLGVRDSIAALPGAISPATQEIFTMENSLVNLGTAEQEMSRAMEDGNVTALEKQRITAAVNKELKEGQVAGGLFTNALAKEADILAVLNPKIEDSIDYTKGLNAILQTSNTTLKTNEGVVVRSGGAFVQMGGAVKDMGNGLSNVGGIIVKNSDIVNKSGLSAEKNAQSTKVMQAAWQDVTATAEDMDNAMTQLGTTQQNNIDKNYDMAHALLTLIDSERNQTEALSATHLAYAQSEDRLADLNAIMGDSEALHEEVQTAVNNTTAALLEESIKLEAASQSADSLSDSQLRLDNAFKSGVVSIKEWANGLAEARKEQEGQLTQLGAMGAKWSDIPPFVERNIETLKLFGVAAKEGGEAAKEAATMAADAWRDATSEMGGEIDGLVDILMKGGDDMDDATDDWFEGIEQKLGRELTGAEETALEKLADMQMSTEQAINEWQLGQLMGESVSAGGADLAGAFEDIGLTMEGGMRDVYNRAAEIARTDGGKFAAQVNEVMKNAGKTGPAALLGELNAILPSGLKDSATKAGEGIPGSLDPAAAQAGQSAALTLSQEFAAAGTHIRSVIDGIKKNLATIGAKGAAKGINLGIYYRYYIIGKPPQPKPLNLGIYYRYYIVNAKPNPPNIQKGIYYRYYVVGSRPNPPNLQRTITYRYRTVGTRPAQTGMHENLAQDTLIAAHKGERVDITPGTINTNENRTAIIPASGTNNRPINITVRGDVNGKELIRFVKFNLMENTGGVM